MKTSTAEVKLYASWVCSLKEKRMVVQSLIAKIRKNFNVSVAEVAEQDKHRIIVLGIACVSESGGYAAGVIDRAISLIESETQAELTEIHKEQI
jgi:uncharacterized protein YlxP (DUF503 family)